MPGAKRNGDGRRDQPRVDRGSQERCALIVWKRFQTQRVAEAAIGMAQLTLRTAVLINGGAAIAIHAFIGGLVEQRRIEVAQLKDVSSSLLWFASGFTDLRGHLTYCTNFLTASRYDTWRASAVSSSQVFPIT